MHRHEDALSKTTIQFQIVGIRGALFTEVFPTSELRGAVVYSRVRQTLAASGMDASIVGILGVTDDNAVVSVEKLGGVVPVTCGGQSSAGTHRLAEQDGQQPVGTVVWFAALAFVALLWLSSSGRDNGSMRKTMNITWLNTGPAELYLHHLNTSGLSVVDEYKFGLRGGQKSGVEYWEAFHLRPMQPRHFKTVAGDRWKVEVAPGADIFIVDTTVSSSDSHQVYRVSRADPRVGAHANSDDRATKVHVGKHGGVAEDQGDRWDTKSDKEQQKLRSLGYDKQKWDDSDDTPFCTPWTKLGANQRKDANSLGLPPEAWQHLHKHCRGGTGIITMGSFAEIEAVDMQ
jgi:hypothetical protein